MTVGRSGTYRSVHKTIGIETEYGIMVRGAAEQLPMAASSLLVRRYVETRPRGLRGNTNWDYVDEHPSTDARDPRAVPSAAQFMLSPELDTHLANAVLTNGARLYVDHAHPEYSSPEVATALEAVCWDRAGELVMVAAIEAANAVLPPGQELVIYKNNSDGKGNSYGCHENYLVSRDVPFALLAAAITPHLVTRAVFCGAGKVGVEGGWHHEFDPEFQLTQRADFFEEPIGLETTIRRPIVNTRDEPHADPKAYRRLHVIVGDANMSEWATYVKVGTTAIVLAMIEDGWDASALALADPVRAFHEVSADPELKAQVQLVSGQLLSALDVQNELLAAATDWVATHDCASVGGADVCEALLMEWQSALDDLAVDPELLADRADWVAKRRIVEHYADRHGLAAGDARLRAIDLQYHDLRPTKSIAAKAGLRRMISEADVASAVMDPPPSTRAYFRGRAVRKFGELVAAANWDSLVFETEAGRLVRVPMLEPMLGGEDRVGPLLDRAETVDALLDALGH